MDFVPFLAAYFVVSVFIVSGFFYRKKYVLGSYGDYQFKDKRTKNVTLHLKTSSIPKNPAKSRKLVKSLFSTIIYLHQNDFEQVRFRSHLLNESRIKLMKSILNKEGYVITDMFRLETPMKDRLSTHWSTIISVGEIRKVHDISWDLTIKLK